MPSSSRSKLKSKRRAPRNSNRGQRKPEPARITEIQEALAREGAYTGRPTGNMDAATLAALRKFQESHGLNPTGKLDALSLQKLGLGSEVAGAAAPLPLSSAVPATSHPD
jgi:peptidoglycan hydrolase-like protein with peptidoglycan-binding domain